MPEPQEPRLTVFISSSLRDLSEHRHKVREACQELGFEVEMFDALSPSTESAVSLLRGAIERADIFILILGFRYGGSLDGNISWTEMEYDHATQLQKNRLIFLMDPTHPVRREYVDQGEAEEKLEAFKKRLLAAHAVGFFKSPEHLYEMVVKALGPFVRQPSPDPALPDGAGAALSLRSRGLTDDARPAKAASDQHLTDKSQDRIGFKVYAEALSAFIASPDTATPLTIGIDAPWGQGKTSLMWMIRNELSPPGPRAERLGKWARLQRWRLRWLAASTVFYVGRAVARFASTRGEKALPAFDVLYAAPAATVGVGESAADAHDLERLFRWCVEVRRPGRARHPTVWFNAWKFDHEEAIWSAMASAILDQLKAERAWPARVAIWLRLQLRRANRLKMLREFAGKILWPLLLAGGALLWARYGQEMTRALELTVSDGVRNAITAALGLAAGLTSGLKLASIIEDPFSVSFKDYVDAPDYKSKIGFVGEFGEDFKRIVAVATSRVWGWEPRKLIVFIDDLDRCEPPKSADVIEAINIFLDSPGCVFVIGMDSRAIVASIETKYEEMFKRMQSESPDQPTLGRHFLEKIIQVPFTIPPIPPRSLSELVKGIIGERPAGTTTVTGTTAPGGSAAGGEGTGTTSSQGAAPGGGTSAPSNPDDAPRVDVGSYGNLDVWNAINGGVKYLASNPRQLKRFVNSFRLQLYIADARELFRELVSDDRGPKGYTLDSLAAWTALCMRWPQIATCLNLDGQQDEFRRWLSWLAQSLKPDGGWSAKLFRDSPQFLKPASLALLNERVKRQDVTLKHALLLAVGPSEGPASDNNNDRERPRGVGYDWKTLPWGLWLEQRDLLQAIKALEDWWELPSEEQKDWLTMALLTSD